jgi:hypothetical protein
MSYSNVFDDVDCFSAFDADFDAELTKGLEKFKSMVGSQNHIPQPFIRGVRTRDGREIDHTIMNVSGTTPISIVHPAQVNELDITLKESVKEKLLREFKEKHVWVDTRDIHDCLDGNSFMEGRVNLICVPPRLTDSRYTRKGDDICFVHDGVPYRSRSFRKFSVSCYEYIPLGKGLQGYGIFSIWVVAVPLTLPKDEAKENPVAHAAVDFYSRLSFGPREKGEICVPRGVYEAGVSLTDGYLQYSHRGQSYRISGDYERGDAALLCMTGGPVVVAVKHPGRSLSESMISYEASTGKIFPLGFTDVSYRQGQFVVHSMDLPYFPYPYDFPVNGQYGSKDKPLYYLYCLGKLKLMSPLEISAMCPSLMDFMAHYCIYQDVFRLENGTLMSRSFYTRPTAIEKLGMEFLNPQADLAPTSTHFVIQGLLACGFATDHDAFKQFNISDQGLRKMASRMKSGLRNVRMERHGSGRRLRVSGPLEGLEYAQFRKWREAGRRLLGLPNSGFTFKEFYDNCVSIIPKCEDKVGAIPETLNDLLRKSPINRRDLDKKYGDLSYALYHFWKAGHILILEYASVQVIVLYQVYLEQCNALGIAVRLSPHGQFDLPPDVWKPDENSDVVPLDKLDK